jgi:hypothetical protein
MMNVKSIALIAMAVVAASATSAPAGTKYAANLVYNAVTDPPGPGVSTLSAKSSLKLDDKGNIAVSLAGVTVSACVGGTNDAASCSADSECPGGACTAGLATSSTLYNDSVKSGGNPSLDGTEFIVIIRLYLPDIAGLFAYVEVPIPVDVKAGKGKTKLNAQPLFALIPAGAGRTVEIQGTQIWGPLGASNASACQSTIDSSLPVIFPGDTTTCRGGTNFGMSGLFIPPAS